jgi:hypothetical protein
MWMETVTLELHIGAHWERINLSVTNLRQGQIFLGHDWLTIHNPSVDWEAGVLKFNCCPPDCQPRVEVQCTSLESDVPDDLFSSLKIEEGDHLLMINLEPEIQIWRMTNIAMELVIKAHEAQPKKHWKETIPSYLHDFADVFEKKDFNKLPPHYP